MRIILHLGAILSGFLLVSCAAPDAGAPKDDLARIGFAVLKSGNYEPMKNRVMDLGKYQQLPEFKAALEGKDADQAKRFIEEHSFEKQKEKFGLIQKILSELEFDSGKASLQRLVVKKPGMEKDAGSNTWMEYDPADPRQRLDIIYLVESEGNYAQLKLDDTYIVGGQRYLGDGFYLSAYVPKPDASETVHQRVSAYSLDSYMPSFIELVNESKQKKE